MRMCARVCVFETIMLLAEVLEQNRITVSVKFFNVYTALLSAGKPTSATGGYFWSCVHLSCTNNTIAENESVHSLTQRTFLWGSFVKKAKTKKSLSRWSVECKVKAALGLAEQTHTYTLKRDLMESYDFVYNYLLFTCTVDLVSLSNKRKLQTNSYWDSKITGYCHTTFIYVLEYQ